MPTVTYFRAAFLNKPEWPDDIPAPNWLKMNEVLPGETLLVHDLFDYIINDEESSLTIQQNSTVREKKK